MSPQSWDAIAGVFKWIGISLLTLVALDLLIVGVFALIAGWADDCGNDEWNRFK